MTVSRNISVALVAMLGLGWAMPAGAQLVINEVCANNKSAIRNGSSNPDYVELYNPTANTVSLAGWSLTDATNSPIKYVFPASATIGPGEFLIVWCDSDTNEPGLHTGFKLKDNTDDVGLFKNSILQDYVVFGLQIPDWPISRAPDGSGAWQLSRATPGAANAAVTQFGSPFALKINEWMATNSAGALKDWVEIYNPATNGPVVLTGIVISDTSGFAGKKALPPLSFINSNGFIRFWANDNALPFPAADADELPFKISSSNGDDLYLYSATGVLIDYVNFLGQAQTRDWSQGRLPDGDSNIVYFPPNRTTPGDSNFLPLTNVVANEILAHTDPPLEDAIEFYNPNPTAADLSNFWLSNNEFNPKKYRLPANTIVQPYTYLVIYENQFNNPANPSQNPIPFTFNSARGDQVALFSADAAGNLTGYRLIKEFGATENGVSLGRYVKSDGGTDYVPMSSLSLGTYVTAQHPPELISVFRTGAGTNNPYPLVGPIVISEIMYHPSDIIEGTNRLDNSLDEYVELRNIASTNVPLYNPLENTNRWQVSGGIEFEFPTGANLPPGGSLLLVNFDPATNAAQLAAFRAVYGLGPETPLYGPYKGKLANSVMTIELNKPDWVQKPPHPDAGYVPRILVEKVKYEDTAPWPTNGVDGGGYSLHRLSLSGYGNDQTNWFGAVPTPGAADFPPAIQSPPQGQAAGLGGTVVLSVGATGTGPLSYQWQRNGTNLPGQVSSNLTLVGVTAAQAGDYRVVVSNPLGGATSAVATVTISAGPAITQSPQSQSVIAGGNAHFSVTASGSGALSYQWQFNTQNLGGQTASNLVLVNVQTNQAGGYRVLVSDSGGTSTSAVATLTVAGPPNLAPPQKNGDGSFVFGFGTTPGFTYAVDGTTNLTHWSTVAIYSNAAGTIQITDQGANGHKFYRARIVSAP